MAKLKDGPAWRVTRRLPKAHALKQRTGGWKVFTGDYKTGNQCIGEGESPWAAWQQAERTAKAWPTNRI